MKSKPFRWLAGVIAITMIGIGIAWQTEPGSALFNQMAANLPASWQEEVRLSGNFDVAAPIRASGIIQADEITIASEFGGLITAMPVAEGDAVDAGALLVALDTAVLDAQIAAAEAGVALAEAGLAQARAGARPTEIAIAEAQLAQAETGVAVATQVVSDTQALVDNPQDLRMQIALLQAQINAAGYRLSEATANKDAVEIAKDTFESVNAEFGGNGRVKALASSGGLDGIPQDIADEIGELTDGVYAFRDYELHINNGQYELYKWVSTNIPFSLHMAPNQWWQAWVGVNAAAAQQEGLQASLAQLYAQLDNPQMLAANVDEALAAVAQAEAQVLLAQAQLDGYQAGATDAQISLLEEQVAKAQSVLAALEAQREQLTLSALDAGVVIDCVLNPGEVAAPGAPIMTMARLSELRLRVYVPEAQFGHVSLGQQVEVAVDSFPDRVFTGTVSFVEDQVEFTPRNVTTAEERALLVFAVDIELQNDDDTLKPGMPADVVFVMDSEVE